MSPLVRRFLIVLAAAGAIAAIGDPAAARSGQEVPPPGKGAATAPVSKPTPKPTPTPTADPGEQLEEFVPTEELPADQAVAFPVDI